MKTCKRFLDLFGDVLLTTYRWMCDLALNSCFLQEDAEPKLDLQQKLEELTMTGVWLE